MPVRRDTASNALFSMTNQLSWSLSMRAQAGAGLGQGATHPFPIVLMRNVTLDLVLLMIATECMMRGMSTPSVAMDHLHLQDYTENTALLLMTIPPVARLTTLVVDSIHIMVDTHLLTPVISVVEGEVRLEAEEVAVVVAVAAVVASNPSPT